MIILIVQSFTKNSELRRRCYRLSVWRILYLLPLLITGCYLSPFATTFPATPPPTAALPLPTLSVYPWADAAEVMSGVCFEAALDAADRTITLRNAAAHIAFYDSIDDRNLCRLPVTRGSFEFTGGRVLAGLWSSGRGCTAHHEVLDYTRDDTARIFTLRLRFITQGDCDYELLRPFWIALPGAGDYEIQILLE